MKENIGNYQNEKKIKKSNSLRLLWINKKDLMNNWLSKKDNQNACNTACYCYFYVGSQIS